MHANDPGRPRPGEPARFRRAGRERPGLGRVVRLDETAVPPEVTVRDADGAARTFRLDAVEVLRPGPRGRLTWQRADRLRTEAVQGDLFADVDDHGGTERSFGTSATRDAS